MNFQEISDELLISSYLKAVAVKLDNSFIELLFNEIEHRNLQPLLLEDIINF
jgi:hypothetical protein